MIYQMNMSLEVEILKIKESPHGIIELRSDNILVFRPDLKTFKQYDVQVLKDLKVDFLEITDGIPRPYMCDNRHVSILVNSEEKAFINEHFTDFATHLAMITHSSLMNIMLNSFNRVFKPKFEFRLFRSEEDAVGWLLNKSVDK